MPRVPVYQRQVEQTQLPMTPLQGGYTSEIIGAQNKQQTALVQSVEKAGSAGVDLVVEAGKTRVEDTARKLRDIKNQLTYDPKVGFINQRGEQAVKRESGLSLTEEYTNKFTEAYQKLSDGLNDGFQKDLFSRQADAMRVEFESQTTQHTAKEANVWTKNVKEATIQSLIDDTALSYNNTAKIQANIDGIKQAAREMYAAEGIDGSSEDSAKVLDQKTKALTSLAHKGAIKTALSTDRDPLYAEKYLERVKDELDAGDYTVLKANVNQAMDQYVGTTTANNVMSKMMPTNIDAFVAGYYEGKIPTLTEVERKIKEDLGPDARQDRIRAAVTEARHTYTEMLRAKDQRSDMAVANALQLLKKNGGNFNALPRETQLAIPPDRVGGVISKANQLYKGQDITTDQKLWLDLTNNPERLKSMPESEFMALQEKLSTKEWQSFARQRAKLVNPSVGSSNKKDPNNINESQIKQILNQRFQEIGVEIPTRSSPNDDIAGYALKLHLVQDAVLQQQVALGKQLNDKETAEVVDSLMAQKAYTKDPGWFRKNRPAAFYEIDSVGDIPDTEQQQVKNYLKEKFGITNPDDAQIIKTYLRAKRDSKK